MEASLRDDAWQTKLNFRRSLSEVRIGTEPIVPLERLLSRNPPTPPLLLPQAR